MGQVIEVEVIEVDQARGVCGSGWWWGERTERLQRGTLATESNFVSMEIAKVVKIMKMSEQRSDFEYWQTRPVAERLAALEEIRAEYHGKDYESQRGLQRVFRISKLK